MSLLISAYGAVLVVWATLEIRDLHRSGYPGPALVAETVVDLGLLAGLTAFAARLTVPLQPLWAAATPILAGAAVALRIVAFNNEEADLDLSPSLNRSAHLAALAINLVLIAPAVFATARVAYPGARWPTPVFAIAAGVCAGTVLGLHASRFAGVFRSEQERHWRAVGRQLYTASAEALERFAGEHSAETVYGFMFACNADYGEVLLCLNTEAHLAERSAHYRTSSHGDVDARLRWNPGDWKYQGFNSEPPYAKSWNAGWSALQEAIASACLEDEGDETRERFLETVCRVLVAMERNGLFECLIRDNGFKTLVTDHDEAPEDAWKRLLRIRNGSGP